MDKISKEIMAFTSKVDADKRRAGYEAFNFYMKEFEYKRATPKMHKDMFQFFMKEVGYFTNSDTNEVPDINEFLRFTHNKEAVFAVVTRLLNQIIPDYIQPQIGGIAESQYGAWGDSFQFKVTPRDLFQVSKVGKNKRRFNVQRYYNNEVTLIPELHALTVGLPFWEVMLGKYTLGEFMSKAARSLALAIQTDMLEAFIAFFENIDDPRLRVDGWDQMEMMKLARRVGAWNGGAVPILFGTQIGLNSVLPDNPNWSVSLEDPFVADGFIRQIGKVRTVELDPVVDMAIEFGIFREDIIDKRIWVMSPGADSIVKVAIAGTGMSNVDATFENANMLLTGTLWQGWKAQVITNSVAGLIELA